MKIYSEKVMVLTKFKPSDFYYDFNDNLSGLINPLNEIDCPTHFVHVPVKLVLTTDKIKMDMSMWRGADVKYRKLTKEQEDEAEKLVGKTSFFGWGSEYSNYHEKISGKYDDALYELQERHFPTVVTIGAKDSMAIEKIYVHESPEEIMEYVVNGEIT